MAKQYKALKPIGRWAKGDTIGDLPQVQIEKLLSDGLIIEVKTEPKSTKEVKVNG